jgi:DNA-binding FrmR family transcriptional regulator
MDRSPEERELPMAKPRVLTREDIAHRLARIAGHATSLKRLWEEERDYDDMLIQVAAVRAALDQVARAILEQHLQQRITEAVTQQQPEQAIRALQDALDRFV